MATHSSFDHSLSGYAFPLPEEAIAQFPAAERTASRLMRLPRRNGPTATGSFADIAKFLPEGCLLVANNARVVPARVFGTRPGGGKVELLLLTPLPLLEAQSRKEASGRHAAEAEVLLRPAKKIRPGDVLRFTPDLRAILHEQGSFGRSLVTLTWRDDLKGILERCGQIPLPPYIRRPAKGNGSADRPEAGPVSQGVWGSDRDRYQTTFAREDKSGCVAAPTAGLHFTPELRAALVDSGREWAEVTLYVGYGTFSPVRCPDIREHAMHAEYVELSAETAQAVAKAKSEGRAVVAVGTTSCRVIEGVFAAQQKSAPSCESGSSTPSPFTGWIDIFLYPGKPFHIIDGLLTNFHLPESSLLMLVSAFAGRERVLSAYRQAVEKGFRFFSYGDAMLIV